jgi:hypothetical protein
VNTLASAPSVESITTRIAPLRQQLAHHPLYRGIQTAQHLRTFMESHVFAVWDFMSLLKSLQSHLTCVSIPWHPTQFPESRRFINEIVLGEESDLYQGRTISHFELYLEAMRETGANTTPIQHLLGQVKIAGKFSLESDLIPDAARRFVQYTFSLIDSGRLPAIAAAFTFGREDIIPDIFRSLVHDLNRTQGNKFAKFIWYLERHIEVDSEDHGPLSLRMIADLCGSDPGLWEEAASAAESALTARIALWDGISDTL